MTNSMKESDTLLILESDKSLRKGIAVALLEYFTQITTTDNPEEAITASKRKDFSVIITGDEFPDQNGLEIIKQLRINNPLAKLYIISKNYDDDKIRELNKLNPQKIYPHLIKVSQLIEDIRQTQ